MRQNSARQFLSPDLSISKLWRAWKAERESSNLPTASWSTVAEIFRRKFNLSFKRPCVDVCSYCEEMTKKISLKTNEDENKALLKLHLACAKRFYQILR